MHNFHYFKNNIISINLQLNLLFQQIYKEYPFIIYSKIYCLKLFQPIFLVSLKQLNNKFISLNFVQKCKQKLKNAIKQMQTVQYDKPSKNHTHKKYKYSTKYTYQPLFTVKQQQKTTQKISFSVLTTIVPCHYATESANKPHYKNIQPHKTVKQSPIQFNQMYSFKKLYKKKQNKIKLHHVNYKNMIIIKKNKTIKI
eukprot:TRINITY_DN23944_c0_g1_i1.p1 TRINITY_DN23944_c0_g1~~TRINITY_DN23944_c0_g1_i1.p1  ORF type:complete len:197 (+),score=-14.88 TRINITY_DN23944_c0_g1_i1:196-786(+)